MVWNYTFQVSEMWEMDFYNIAEVLFLWAVAMLSPWEVLPMETMRTIWL